LKGAPKANAAQMKELPNIVRERLKAAPVGDHPDPDLLTGFAERALADRERTRVLDHLARCADCRDVIALATPPVLSGPSRKDTARATNAPWFSWPTLRWGALAACVVIVGAAVLVQHDSRRDSRSTYIAKEAAPEPVLALPSSPDAKAEADAVAHKSQAQEALVAKHSENRNETFAFQPLAVAPAPASSGTGRDQSRYRYAFGNRTSNGVVAGTAAGGVAPALQSSSPPPSTPRKDAAAQNLPIEGRDFTELGAVSKGATQAVEVQASTAAVETATADSKPKSEAPGRAKQAPQMSSSVLGTGEPALEASAQTLSTIEVTSSAKTKREFNLKRRADVARWTISSDGQLQHSLDSGKTWQPVVVADKVTLRALSVNGPDLWIGGAAGLLYHSIDAGSHWMQVKPAANAASLTADIAAIAFADPQHGRITTSTGESWLTADAGQTWHKQP
jgi:hypothetical protein